MPAKHGANGSPTCIDGKKRDGSLQTADSRRTAILKFKAKLQPPLLTKQTKERKFMNPPIKWYGGKTNIAKWICGIIDRYKHTSYIEPFGGSGAVLFAKEPSPLEVYNDIYGDVVNMYRIIRDEKTFHEFKRFVALTPYSREMCMEASTMRGLTKSDAERAAMFFVAARQCFGGLRAGSSGWSCCVELKSSKQASAYINTVDRLDDIHRRLAAVQIENRDAVDCIRRYAFDNTNGCSLIYADPPYVFSTRVSINVYQYEFTDYQHIKLIDTLLSVPGHKILSGYRTPLYEPLLDAGWTLIEKPVKLRRAGRKAADRIECLYCSPVER